VWGALTISGCTVSGNTAFEGGRIANFGTLTVSASTVSGNSAIDRGGGILMDGPVVTVSGSTISNNATFAGGGGIFVAAGALTVTGSTVSGNSAISGGGICNLRGGVTISGSILSGNSATGVVISNPSGVFPLPGVGGAIYNGAILTVSGCALAGNSATGVNVGGIHYASQGGAIANSGTMTVRDSFFIATNSFFIATNSAAGVKRKGASALDEAKSPLPPVPPGIGGRGFGLAPWERSRPLTPGAVLAAQTASIPSRSGTPASAVGPSVWTRPNICPDHG
jgi:hypothetical protein